VRDTAALYDVRQAFGFWLRNEFDCAGTEVEIHKLIDAIDGALACMNSNQQAWDRAVGDVNFSIHMLEGLALVGNGASLHAFVVKQKAYLVARGVLV
jgi:hypothetical protein